MGLAERFPFDFAQGRLHDQKRTKRRGAEDAERFPFDFAQGRLSTARANNVRSAPLGYAPFMEFFRASGAGSMTMQRRKSGVEPPHSKNRGEQGDGEARGFPIGHEARRGALTKRRAGVNWRFIFTGIGGSHGVEVVGGKQGRGQRQRQR